MNKKVYLMALHHSPHHILPYVFKANTFVTTTNQPKVGQKTAHMMGGGGGGGGGGVLLV